MAASASDVRSILSLPQPQTGPSVPAARKSSAISRKPEGISRELYSLIGNAAPSLTIQYAKPKLKQRPDFGKGKTRWEWLPFRNNARADDLQLSHWEKATPDQPSAEYSFSKYNTTIQTYTYSLDEYTRLLEDTEWTKAETDYLFDQVKQYEMRWYVIDDRYEYPEGTTRTLDDLKARYYAVCKKLIQTRPWAGDQTSRLQTLNAYTFDKEREIARKKYVGSLLSRTPEQIAEEEALFIEIKKLEQTERRFAKDRDDLLKTLLGIDSGLASIQTDDDGPTAQIIVNRKTRRRMDGIELDNSSNLSLGPAQSLRKSTSAKSNAQDILNCVHRFETQGSVASNTKTNSTPVYLRSSRLPGPKPSMAARITGTLDEMGVAYHRLIMPTRATLTQLEHLFDAAAALVETKRAVDRVEQDIKVCIERKKLRAESVQKSEDGSAVQVKNPSDKEADGVQAGSEKGSPMNDDAQDDQAEANADDEPEDADVDMEQDGEGEGGKDGGEEEEEDADAEEEADAENDGGDEDDAEGDREDGDFSVELREEETVNDDDNVSEAPSQPSRKRRGLSTSSMDTSGTTMTRRSSKRNKKS